MSSRPEHSADDDGALLSHVTGKSRAQIIAHGVTLDPQAQARYDALCARLDAGEPLAYLIGSAGFYRREFLVDPRVLIPRPETEHLVDEAIAHLRAYDAPRIIDIGTGSGAIASTLAAELPNARVDAVDLSREALEVARENAQRLAVDARVRFVEGDLLEPFAGMRYDAIVANLPYVPDGQGEESLRFEPPIALYAGSDGLAAYRRLFTAAPQALAPGGLLLAEGAPPIAQGLLALARAAFPRAAVSLERDYGKRERYVKVMTPA
jgi:release factor glutamine methyltransferase